MQVFEAPERYKCKNRPQKEIILLKGIGHISRTVLDMKAVVFYICLYYDLFYKAIAILGPISASGAVSILTQPRLRNEFKNEDIIRAEIGWIITFIFVI